jgi:hypothetical protein
MGMKNSLRKNDLLGMYPEILGRPMRSITSLPDFVAWAKEVNFCAPSTKRWCDLQDIYARSVEKDLISWYVSKESENDRRLLLFSVYKCMGEDPFMRFVNYYALQKAQEKIREWESVYNEELDSRHKDLRKLESEAREKLHNLEMRELSEPVWRKSAYKKIRALREIQEKWAVRLRAQEKTITDLYNKLAEKNGKPKRMISV